MNTFSENHFNNYALTVLSKPIVSDQEFQDNTKKETAKFIIIYKIMKNSFSLPRIQERNKRNYSHKHLMNIYRIEVYLPQNDVMAISEGLKKMDVGELTVIKKRGRGKYPPPEIHAGKGSIVFTPQFTEKFVVELIIDEKRKQEAIEIIRANSKKDKIFIFPVIETIDWIQEK